LEVLQDLSEKCDHYFFSREQKVQIFYWSDTQSQIRQEAESSRFYRQQRAGQQQFNPPAFSLLHTLFEMSKKLLELCSYS
jgi:pyridoxine/pyridoxamine 5'-phosphate oxidase